jgi:hypothetical protein
MDSQRRKAIRKEIREAFRTELIEDLRLKNEQIGEAVELYYESQSLRIRFQNKERSEGPAELTDWFNYWLQIGETTMFKKLEQWVRSDSSPSEAKWAFDLDGIGPVLAAGLAAHIDPSRSKYVSSLWKYAGLAPGADKPVKGIRLPYNARLKTLCYKIGESFVKVSGKDGAFYGQLYRKFKDQEIKRNIEGAYGQVAAKILQEKKWRADTLTRKRLEEGKLSDGHLHSRARRRTVKIFLQGYWLKGRESRGLPTNLPWAFGPGGHDSANYIVAA